MKKLALTIAIDFDGVIHKYSKGWHDKTVYDVPIEGAFDAINRLQIKGYTVYILTARNPTEVEAWMTKHYPPEYGPIPDISNVKRAAVAYIDDRAIRFTNWKDILNYF